MNRQINFLLGMFVFSAATFAADLPVRQVILYKHGIGYFERAGQVAPGSSARLEFKASDMNDVLKSLTVTRRGEGAIVGLRYDAADPLQKKLEGFPFRLGDRQTLSALLDELKGARIELKAEGENIAGAIVGARTAAGTERLPERELITLMLDSGEMRVIDLGAAPSIRFQDSALRRQFQDYLRVVLESRSKDKRSLYIDSSDKAKGEITVGYMIPMPIWKSSYRLIFDGTAQATLEGWAIVDNTTGEDWTSVQLSLVSGRPISFISRLYEPRYIARPTAELPEERAQAPVVYGGAIQAFPAAPKPMAKPEAKPFPKPAPALRTAPATAEMAREREPSSVVIAASAGEVGELFEYRIPGVTVRGNESAMLPFVQQKLAARKLLIYSSANSTHPLNAAELANATGKTLDGGPITVYEGGAYGGEALMGTLKAGDKRLISFGVDLGTLITTRFDSKAETVREVYARRGEITTRTAVQETRTYTIRNVDQKAKVLVIEHPARQGFTLLERKPLEKTATGYRFEVKLAPAATETFPVVEEYLRETTTLVANLTPDEIVAYVRNKQLSDAARNQLQEIGRRKEQLASLEATVRETDSEIKNIASDQERIRKNLDTLNRISGQQEQVQRYAGQLAEQEGRLAALRDRNADLVRQRDSVRKELDRLVGSLSF